MPGNCSHLELIVQCKGSENYYYILQIYEREQNENWKWFTVISNNPQTAFSTSSLFHYLMLRPNNYYFEILHDQRSELAFVRKRDDYRLTFTPLKQFPL